MQPAPVKSNDLKELKNSSNIRYGVSTKLETKHSDALSGDFYREEAKTAEVHISEEEGEDYMQDEDIPIDEDDGSEISDNYENLEDEEVKKGKSSDISMDHSDDMNMGDDDAEENEEEEDIEDFE